MNLGRATTGFTGQEDATLLPDLDQNGDIIYPDFEYKMGMLCDVCQVVMSKAEVIFDRYGLEEISRVTVVVPFYATKAEIGLSVGIGCHLCSIFLLTEKTKRSFYSEPFDPVPNRIGSWITLNKDYYHIRMRQLRNGIVSGYSVKVYSQGSLPDHTGLLSVSNALSASNASEAIFRSASAWLVSCLKEHGHESTGLQPLQSPKRLLYLGDQLDRRLRVVYPTTPTSYLTVSHCWGGKVNRTLNAETYSELTTGFEDTWLPRLWRDCVIVTRRLGYAYLWIDSLYIQQDNASDKAQEIMNMGDIYSGSVCNIAAVSAADSSASLFTRYVRLGFMSLDVGKKSTSDGKMMSVLGIYPSSPTPLYERAWVVQERVLAPRTLEYTWQGVRHCCSSTVLEKSYLYRSLDLSAQWAELIKCEKEQLSNLDKRKILDLWMKIVCQYTEAALTMETDRNIALNGIIAVLSKHTGLSFCSGVCKDLAPYSLLWCMHEVKDLTRQPPYADPSWSCTFRSAKVAYARFGRDLGDCTSIDCSFDELRSIVSFNARCSGERMIKTAPGPCQSNLREHIGLQNLHGIWIYYRKLELFDKTYHDRVEFSVWSDYYGFDPMKVEFALLSYTTFEAHGLVLTKTSGAESLWKRHGMFELRISETEAAKAIQDPLAFMLAPWQTKAEFQVC